MESFAPTSGRAELLEPSQVGFPGARLAARLETRVKRGGKWHREVVYLLSSLTLAELQALEMLSLKRGYWVIESRLHHCLDITLREDQSPKRNSEFLCDLECTGCPDEDLSYIDFFGFTKLYSWRNLWQSHSRSEGLRLIPSGYCVGPRIVSRFPPGNAVRRSVESSCRENSIRCRLETQPSDI